MPLTDYQPADIRHPVFDGPVATPAPGAVGRRTPVGRPGLEVPQPAEPSTPVIPDAPVSPADPDPGTPADPERPATVPEPEEPATPAVPEPGPGAG